MNIKKANARRRGFSLVEMVVTILIVGILSAATISFGGKQVANTRYSTMQNTLRMVGSEVETAIIDLGFLSSDDLADSNTRENYFSQWDRVYLSSPIDFATLTYEDSSGCFGSDYSGVSFSTENYKDPWDNDLRFYYLCPEGDNPYRIIIASAGPNGHFSEQSENAYLGEESDDDVFLIMEPRS